MDNGKIAHRQFQIMTILFVMGPALLFVPSTVASIAGQDAWLSGVFGTGIGLLVIAMYNAMSRRHPGLSLVQMCERIIGKWPGKLLSLLYVFLFFILLSLQVRTVGNFVTIHMLDRTPIEVIHIVLVAIAIVAVRLGIETIARASELLFPFVLVLLVCMFLFLVPEIRMNHLQPMLENGWKPVLLGAIHFFSFQETVLLIMIVPFALRPQSVGKAFASGTLLASLILIAMIVLTITVLGVDTTVRTLYGSYTVAKKINIGNFLQRVEVIIAVVWLITIFIRTAICLHITVTSMAQIARLRNPKSLVYPIGILAIVYSTVLYSNDASFLEFTSKIWWLYGCTFFIVLPLLLLVVDGCKTFFQNRRKREI